METTFDDLSVPTLTDMALEKGLIKNKNQAKTLKKAGLVQLLQAWQQQEQTLAKVKEHAKEALAASEQVLSTNQFASLIGEMLAEGAKKLADELAATPPHYTHLPPVLDPNAIETLPAPPMPEEESFAFRMARKYNTSSTPNLLTPRQQQIKAHNRRKNKAARKARKKNKQR